MRTPAGKECKHYYQDFHRERRVQECRLNKENPESVRWRPEDCARCPVPDILNANASPNLELTLTIKSGLLGFGRRVEVTVRCLKHHTTIQDPYIGCPQCNAERPGLDIFRRALEDADDD
jgi:hypothetical protein